MVARQVHKLVGCLECENPNPKLDSFLGRLTLWSGRCALFNKVAVVVTSWSCNICVTSLLSQRGRWDWSLRAQQRQPPLGWNCPQGLKIIEHKQNMFTSWFDLIIKKKLFSEHQRSVCCLCLRGHSDQDQPQFKNHEEQILFNRTITQQVQSTRIITCNHFFFLIFYTGTWFSSSWFCS